ncbi:MAG: endonuclease, partial [Pedobacter sp.]
YYFVPFSENDYEATGLAIFSRYPIRNKGTIKFGENAGGNSSIFIDIEVNNKKLRVYNVHLQSIAFDKQDYTYIDKVTHKIDADIVPSKRIAVMLRTAFLKRSQQVDIMKQHMRTCSTSFLIAGDFNDTPASYAVTQLTKSLNSTFKEQGTGLGRTYNGKFPNFQIDYIATTTDIKVLNHRVIPAKLSDHFPVRSDLRLNP